MTQAAGQQSKSSERLRALIADDVQETRRSVRLMLALIPEIEVVAIAQNGLQAVEMAKKYRPDVVFMDVNMPEMDGITAIRAMTKIQPDIFCIIISAERDSTTLRNAMSAGARAYLIKPFTTDELDQAVERAVKAVQENRQRTEKSTQLVSERDAYLKQLAQEYARNRRTDDQALAVFEQLASNPLCEMRWLMHLAMVYVLRQDWKKLRLLAERMEGQTRT